MQGLTFSTTIVRQIWLLSAPSALASKYVSFEFLYGTWTWSRVELELLPKELSTTPSAERLVLIAQDSLNCAERQEGANTN